jgi:hypothetical protein
MEVLEIVRNVNRLPLSQQMLVAERIYIRCDKEDNIQWKRHQNACMKIT